MKISDISSLFEYNDYRLFLRDFYARSKQINPDFSYRFLAKLAGIKSPSFFKEVIEGKRNLTLEATDKIISALKMNKQEALYFRNLVGLGQARSSEEKQQFAELLIRSKPHRKIKPLHKYQLSYLSHWYYIPIREMITVKGFIEDPAWIARQLIPKITESEAARAIGELEKLGLISRDQDGKLIIPDQDIEIDPIIISFVAQHHKDMLAKAVESIDRFPRELRELLTLTFSLSESDIIKAKDLFHKFRNELRELGLGGVGPKRVFQMNVQLFPLTEPVKEGEEK